MLKQIIIILTVSSTMVVAGQKKLPGPDAGKPIQIGVSHELFSKELGESRKLNVYLPEDYDRSGKTRYAVAYLLDGGLDEDFLHIVGLYQFSSFEWISQVPKTIVVGIVNVDRKRDFTFPTHIDTDLKKYPTTGHSDRFIAFLQNELQPFIAMNYAVSDDSTIIGQSLGGLLATEILLKKPELFFRYIIVSPSLWWDNGALLNLPSPVLLPSFEQKVQVYVGVGKEGLTPTAIPRVMEVDANSLADKLNASKSSAIKVYFDYLPLENHATILHQAVFNALRHQFPDIRK